MGVDDDLAGLITAFIAARAFAAKVPLPPRAGVDFLKALEPIEEEEDCRLIVLNTLVFLGLGVAAL